MSYDAVMGKLTEIVELPSYTAAADKAKLTEEERDFVLDYLMANPDAGDLIKGTGGLRKVRIPRETTGKSGGLRVLTAYFMREDLVFLISVYAKTKQADLTPDQRKSFAKLMIDLKKEMSKDG